MALGEPDKQFVVKLQFTSDVADCRFLAKSVKFLGSIAHLSYTLFHFVT